jgi:hypothetical protein
MTVYLQEHKDHYATKGWVLSMFTMTNHLGTLEVEHCEYCDHVDVHCIHENNTWNEKGTELICNFCGEDVT